MAPMAEAAEVALRSCLPERLRERVRSGRAGRVVPRRPVVYWMRSSERDEWGRH